LKGISKARLHKYCIRAKNRGYTSLVYVACGMIFMRAFQQDTRCGIYLLMSKVIAYSFMGIIMNESNRVCRSTAYALKTADT
jgi:hypothetical protein